jgi:hypothetical protein
MVLTDDWRMSCWGARVQAKRPVRSCRRSQLRGERSEVLRPWTRVRQVEVASGHDQKLLQRQSYKFGMRYEKRGKLRIIPKFGT